MSDHVPLNCPKCGRPLRPVEPSRPPWFVYSCPDHGLFHYGPKTDLAPGPPPAP